MCEKKENSVLKTILIIIGAVVSIAAIAAAVCYLFKKYFKITFNTNQHRMRHPYMTYYSTQHHNVYQVHQHP